jgi:hypothetical protein
MTARAASSLAAIAFVTIVAGASAAAQQVVGKTSAVNPDATASGRTLAIGASVIHRERIRTDTRGSLQLLFIDRTTITIGPSSDLVIDEYVFDPNRNVGRMTVSLGRGVMRFVGGQVTHSGEATVKTPPATIGIRGGVAVVSVSGRVVTATNVFGSVNVTTNIGPGAGTTSFIRQGHTGTVGAAAAMTTAPATQQHMNTVNRQLQSRPGQTGGASGSTSSSAASISSRPSTTATITPASAPASGSTASGPSSTASRSTSSSSGSSSQSFATGTPSSVSSANQSVQTSSSTTATQSSQPTTTTTTTTTVVTPPPPPPPPLPCPGAGCP